MTARNFLSFALLLLLWFKICVIVIVVVVWKKKQRKRQKNDWSRFLLGFHPSIHPFVCQTNQLGHHCSRNSRAGSSISSFLNPSFVLLAGGLQWLVLRSRQTQQTTGGGLILYTVIGLVVLLLLSTADECSYTSNVATARSAIDWWFDDDEMPGNVHDIKKKKTQLGKTMLRWCNYGIFFPFPSSRKDSKMIMMMRWWWSSSNPPPVVNRNHHQ